MVHPHLMKPRLAISFSGGRSSAVMLKRCIERHSDTHDILIVFANTGCEHEETLRFVDAVDRNFADGKVVWIECVTNGPGVGVGSKVVSFETASRNGEPFKDAIAKHGIPCTTHPQCSSRLKSEPMLHYRSSVGWEPGSYDTAIGIRADECDRMSSKKKENRFVYPLVSEGWRKRDVNEYMAQFDWDLKLPSDAFGNCVWCWKKSLRKLMTVAKESPELFNFPAEMERTFGHINRGTQGQPEPRTFFRKRMSAEQIVEMSKTTNFEPWVDEKFVQLEFFNAFLDTGGGCGDSCEVGSDE